MQSTETANESKAVWKWHDRNFFETGVKLLKVDTQYISYTQPMAFFIL